MVGLAIAMIKHGLQLQELDQYLYRYLYYRNNIQVMLYITILIICYQTILKYALQRKFQIITSEPFDLLASIGKDCIGPIQLIENNNYHF